MGERKVCVVSGSSSGIGAATVKRYAREGWDVVVNFSRSRDPAEAVAHECRALGAAHGVQAWVVQADVADDAQCRRLADETLQHLGRCDVLVNNAGTTKFVPLKNLDGLQAQDFHDIYAVNVVGAYQLTRAFVPLLQQQAHAGVVNISSVASLMGRGSSIAYMASKGAVNAMTVGLARALSPQIRVNAIAPGLVDTPWLRQGLGDRYPKYVKEWTDRAALDDVIQPEDVADAAWWLGAGAAKTTGEVLLLDAGFRLTKP
jgi:NAD(P)-dependent dehydrogenase (short-subunit alcohol dehydrogenase family)